MSIIDEIRKSLTTVPFQPFALRMADGREYTVPTVDHVYLAPGGRHVVVTDDQGVIVTLPTILITGFVQTSPAA